MSQTTINTNESGISFVELLVSMVIGLFLIAGLSTNLISNQILDKNREALSEINANAQLALEVIRQVVSHAGYPSVHHTNFFQKAFYTKEDGELVNPTCRGGRLKRDVKTPDEDAWTRDALYGDTLTVIARPDNPCVDGKTNCPNLADVHPEALFYSDCAGGERDDRAVACSADVDVGMLAPSESKIFSTFRLDNTSRQLMCDGSRSGSHVLAEGVFAMQFLYGINDDTGKTTYKPADVVEDNRQWGLVRSVQVALLMQSSRENVLNNPSSTTSYLLLDRNITIPSNDLRRLYRVYSTTIRLGNLN